MNKKETLARQERFGLLSQLDHLEEYLRDYDRLNYVLSDGRRNVHVMSDGERKGIEARIRELKKTLGFTRENKPCGCEK